MNISEEMEFGGALIRADRAENEQVVRIHPKDKQVQAFFDLKKPSIKRDIHVLCGTLTSLQDWNPNISLNGPMLRKAFVSRGKVTWNKEPEEENQNVMRIMQTIIRLSPYNPKKKLRLVIDSAKTVRTGILLIQ